MHSFTVQLYKEGFGATAVQLPSDLKLSPLTWTATDRGGCQDATVSASGGGQSLASLCGWLGDRLEIYNANGDCVWYGVIWDLEVRLGNVVVTLSMDSIYNRVAVIYPFQLGDGSTESRTTDWAEDTNSIERYGTRELLYGMPESFSRSAETVRDKLLPNLSAPGAMVSSDVASEYSAVINARGVWEKAASVYFTNADGLHEFLDGAETQSIGHYVITTVLAFGSFTDDADPEDLETMSGDLDWLTVFEEGDSFHIKGASQAANNGTWVISNLESDRHIEIEQTFVDEEEGTSIKMSWGEIESQSNIAQSFQVDTPWTATHVSVKVRRIGNPTDNFRIGIYPDSSGIPGTVLGVNETLGSELFTDLTWTEFELDTPVALSAATTYWIGIRRTGTASLADGYEVQIDEDLGYAPGVFKVLDTDGTTWIARDPDCDMPFRVIGEIDSTEQIEKAIDAVGDFGSALVYPVSGVPIRQYTIQEHTAMEEIIEMLDAGMSTGERLIAWVTYDGSVVVETADTGANLGETDLSLGEDGKLRYADGALYAPGRLIFGKNIDVKSVLLLDGLGLRGTRGPTTYVQQSTYDAQNDMITIQSDGAPDPWQALTLKKG